MLASKAPGGSKPPATVTPCHKRQTDAMDSELIATNRKDRVPPADGSPEQRGGVLESAPLRGALAGAFATLPMTAVIYALDRLVPHAEQDELPPRQITEEVAERTGSEDNATETALDLATEAAHFAFGAVAGAIYGSAAQRLPGSPVPAGIGFGLAVWTASYAGILPKLGLQPPPDHRPAWRSVTMIAGHVVWGAALGWSEQRLRSRQ